MAWNYLVVLPVHLQFENSPPEFVTKIFQQLNSKQSVLRFFLQANLMIISSRHGFPTLELL